MRIKGRNLLYLGVLIVFVVGGAVFLLLNDEKTDPVDLKDVYVKQYIHVVSGTGIPVVFTSVHGGEEDNEMIVPRKSGNGSDYILLSDLRTIQLMNETNQMLQSVKGFRAHMVYCSLKRYYIDLNRNYSNENSYQDPNLEGFHQAFYKRVEELVNLNALTLVIDFHGFSSSNRPPEEHNITIFLGTRNNRSVSIDTKSEMVKILSNNTLSVSPDHYSTFSEVFSGGYNLNRFAGYPNYNGIQIEFSDKVRLESQLKFTNNLERRNTTISNILSFIDWWILNKTSK